MQYEKQKVEDEKAELERQKHMFEIEKRQADIKIKDNHSKLSSLNTVSNTITDTIKKEEQKLKILRLEIDKEKDLTKSECDRLKNVEDDLENRRKENFNEQKKTFDI